MRGTNIGRSKTPPFRSEPAFGQRSEDLIERVTSVGSKDSCDVLQHQPSGSSVARNSDHIVNQPPFVFDAFTFAGRTHRLTRKPCRDDIDLRRVSDLSQVPQVRRIGMMRRHHLCSVLVNLSEPRQVGGYTRLR